MPSSLRAAAVRRLHKIRKLELDAVLERYPLSSADRVLEFGATDGFQASLLRRHTPHVITTDVYRDPSHGSAPFAVALPEAFPFPDRAFDLIISSNVLEHVNNRPGTLSEIRRLLRPEGRTIHIVPTHVWKWLSLVTHPIYYPVHVMNLLARRAGIAAYWRGVGDHRSVLRLVLESLIPPVHGTFRTHADEIRGYRPDSWVELFRGNGFSVEPILPLYFYSQLTIPLFRSETAQGLGIPPSTIAIIAHPE